VGRSAQIAVSGSRFGFCQVRSPRRQGQNHDQLYRVGEKSQNEVSVAQKHIVVIFVRL